MVAVAAVGWERQDDYFDHRYTRRGLSLRLGDVIWAKETSGERIAVASGAYNQYGLYGDRLENYVQYVGQTALGQLHRIEKCPEFREAVNDGDYDHLGDHARPRPQQPGSCEDLARARLGPG